MSKLDRDLEALSAYMDGELPAKEREQIETRLEIDQDLRAWHEELKQTRLLLRNTPALRAPRNFYLTPSMVGQKEKSWRAFPVLRFASAFAALLLVLLFLGDYFVIPKPVSAPSRALLMADSAQEVLEQPLMEAESIESLPPAAPAEEPADKSYMEGEVAPEAADSNISSSMESPLELEKVSPTSQPAPVEETEEMLGGISRAEGEPEQMLESQESINEIDEEFQPGFDFQAAVRMTEIGLLVIALSTGLAALYYYRKGLSL